MTETEKLRKIRHYYEVGESIAAIFENYGFKTHFNKSDDKVTVVFQLENYGEMYAFGYKNSRVVYPKDKAILSAANEFVQKVTKLTDTRVPILVILGVVSDDLRNRLNRMYNNLVIIDIRNLLYMCGANEELRSRFVSQLEFSVENLKPAQPIFTITLAALDEQPTAEENSKAWDDDIRLIEKWEHKNDQGKEYEQVCVKLLKKLFAEDLGIWDDQESTEEGLFRFDLICKIKSQGKEFWNMAERYFHSKYIVFEFKDYKKPVTQKEIFTTVKYLYAKALRCVAIMFSTSGFDDHAEKVIRGILRDEGKLILALSNEDMVEMLRMKRDGDDPADYLSKKLDDLLIHLDK